MKAIATVIRNGEAQTKEVPFEGTESNLSLMRKAKKVFGLDGKGRLENMGNFLLFRPIHEDYSIYIKFQLD